MSIVRGMSQNTPQSRIRLRSTALSTLSRELDISRDEIARRLGVSSATAYRNDAGRNEPSPKFIAALIIFSGKTFDDLFEIVEAAA